MENTLLRKRNPKANNYVDNKLLYEAMVVYIGDHRAGKNPPLTEYIGKCVLLISEGLSKLPKFSGYSFKEDMISDGYLACVAYLHNFDPTLYKNPHAYITKVCYYAFVRRIKIERREQYAKLKSAQRNISFQDLIDEGVINPDLYDNNYEFIMDFEKKLQDKKKKTKLKGAEKFLEE